MASPEEITLMQERIHTLYEKLQEQFVALPAQDRAHCIEWLTSLIALHGELTLATGYVCGLAAHPEKVHVLLTAPQPQAGVTSFHPQEHS